MAENKYLDAVSTLNSELYNKHGEVELSFWYRTDGYADQIGFDEKVLWCSESDGTQYIEDTDQEMDIAYVVRRAFNKYADSLKQLKFKHKAPAAK
jgi:hypothetical protein